MSDAFAINGKSVYPCRCLELLPRIHREPGIIHYEKGGLVAARCARCGYIYGEFDNWQAVIFEYMRANEPNADFKDKLWLSRFKLQREQAKHNSMKASNAKGVQALEQIRQLQLMGDSKK